MRRRLSSALTFRHKVVVPVVWTLLQAGATAYLFIEGDPDRWWALIQAPCSVLFICWLFCPLKYVELDGDTLYVAGYRSEIAVPLSDVIFVSERRWLRRVIMIRFAHTTAFGNSIIFLPEPINRSLFASHPMVAELQQVVEQMQRA
jgi:hypothetical protein